LNQTYIVKAGDTLYGISNQFGVSVTELAELNGIKGSNLAIGTILKIPTKSGSNPNNMFMYTVKSGDSLYSIAKKYNTTVNKIMELNYLKSTALKVGTVLRIPETYTKEEDMIMPNYINYTVKSGDNLYKIAAANNITVDTIIKDNSLISNVLQIGQNLKIRIPSSSNITIEECYGEEYIDPVKTYTVKKGDSLYSVAKKFNTTVDSIKKKNNLTSNLLNIGTVLKI
jgi:LysM repeat protein